AISFWDSVYKKFSNDTVCWELAENAVYGLNSFSVCFLAIDEQGNTWKGWCQVMANPSPFHKMK
ncbi:hypothetical protein ACNVD4_07525, partial [Rhizobium sp. BR5]